MKICVIIPSYNESRTIGSIVKQLRAQALDVLVIDDGSADDTAFLARETGAVVLRNEVNLGKGKSLAKGFEYVLANDFDAAITMDADGQHLPEDIPLFVSLAQKNKACMIIGNRMTERKNMPFIRVVTNKFMSWLISKVAKQRVCDSQCGFRFITRDVLSTIKLKTDKFQIESEMIIEASRKGFPIASVPVQTVYSHEKSHINPVIDTIRFFNFIIPQMRKVK